jgi:hypothetical protein
MHANGTEGGSQGSRADAGAAAERQAAASGKFTAQKQHSRYKNYRALAVQATWVANAACGHVYASRRVLTDYGQNN